MSKLRVNAFSLSLDGFGAGPDQDLQNPLGVGGKALHKWAFSTRTFQKMFGEEGGATGVDDDFALALLDLEGDLAIGIDERADVELEDDALVVDLRVHGGAGVVRVVAFAPA